MNTHTFKSVPGKIALSLMAGALVLFGTMMFAPPADAHQDPVGCNASGLQQFPSIDPATAVFDGDTLTYSVIYNNSDPDGAGSVAPCNVTLADATITLPDGSVINVLTDATLNVGDSISCPGDAGCAAGPYTYQVDHADENLDGEVSTDFNIQGVLHQTSTDNNTAADTDNLSSLVLHPSTAVTINSSAAEVIAGGTVDLTVTEENDGDADLTNVSVDVDNGVGTLTAPPTSGDDGDGILEVGETWSWTVSNVVVNSDTTFTATGHGTVSINGGFDVTWTDGCAAQDPEEGIFCDVDEQASVTVTVIEVGNIIVDKVTDPAGSDASFDFTVTGEGYVDFALTDEADPNDQSLAPGTYTISETELDGWVLTNVECTLNDGEPFVYTPGSDLELGANDTISCVFTNTQEARIIVVKQTDPDGDLTEFEFDPSWSDDNFFLADGEQQDSGPLATDVTYSVEEVNIPGNWELTSATCDGDGNTPGEISLSAGDTVTCTFVNTMVELQGCTPGYWKQSHHFDSWVGYAPGDSFEAVFGVDVELRGKGKATIDDPTLLEALNANGGQINALARHAVAALLNAANPDVEYPFTEAEIIQMVQDAVDSGDFDHSALATANEAGCPLN